MHFRDRSIAAVAAWCGGVLCAGVAPAQVPGATYQLYVDGSQPSPHTAPGTYTGNFSNSQGSFTNSASASTAPAFSISGSSTGINVQTNALLVYFFEVVDSASSAIAPVSLNLTATLSGSASISTASSIAFGGGEIDIPSVLSGIPALTTFCGGINEGAGCNSGSQTISYRNTPFTINANQINEVYMTLSGGTATAGGSYSAMIDPVISLNPNQANAGDYSIIFSQGITNSPVPFPASAWLMLSGLAGLGLMTRRRPAAET